MADLARRRAQNVDGPWFVDDTCIDCGTCMWMAPETFREDDRQSAVHHQAPPGDEQASAALMACPTASIGGPVGPVEWPRAVPGEALDGVWHCGFHDRRSFGAASYLVRTTAGHVMVDVGRFAGPLVQAIEAMGGLDAIVLTHRDDVADHARWAQRFDCPRFIHEDDDVIGDQTLAGQGGEVAGLDWTHVPGHTRGSVVFRHGDVLFTGDHLAGAMPRDPPRHAPEGDMVAFRRACWYDWAAQTRSMQAMQDWSIAHVLPGHGAPWHGTPSAFQTEMRRLVLWMHQA